MPWGLGSISENLGLGSYPQRHLYCNTGEEVIYSVISGTISEKMGGWYA